MPSDNAVPPIPPRQRGTWRIEMLGRLRVQLLYDDGSGERGEPVTQFRTHKTALLLARLALFPHRAHPREELVELLWPDAPADRGRASLTQTLVYLRQALNQPRIGGLFIADHKTVRVNQNAMQTDVAQWEVGVSRALLASSKPQEQATLVQAALASYRGDLLPGFYDDWVSDERNRLTALHDALQAQQQTLRLAAASDRTSPFQKTTEETSKENGCDTPPFVNAPLFLTQFFGRGAECETVCGLVRHDPSARLITISGMGGIGKTRLAVELARVVACDKPVFGWAAFVPLDQALTASQMEGILLSVLGVENKDADGLTAVAKYLNSFVGKGDDGKNRLLLVLDNLEQLGDVSAPVVSRLLALVPRLTIIATSRQPVGVAGEREMPLGPLSGNGDGTKEPPDAVRLFVDRARLVRPSFALTSANREVIYRLCELLEGVPLALELAAAWSRVLTPTQIAARLSNRFDLLRRRGAESESMVPKRHRSLHEAIAWSYSLLGPSLQAFWAQLSVFHGGWTTAAAQAVTNLNEISEPLLLLAERSLILAETDEATGEMRYRMLESLREFAQDQLKAMEPDRYSALRLRHARYFERLARESNAMVQQGDGMRPALTLLKPERDNLRAIFAWLRELRPELAPVPDSGSVALSGVQAAIHSMLESYWLWPVNELGYYLSLASEATTALPAEIRVPLRAAVLSHQGVQSLYAGDIEAAGRHLRESLTLWESIGNREQSVTVRKRLASVAAASGHWSGAIDLLLSCLQFARETGNARLEADILNNLANDGPDLAQRRSWIEQAVVLDRRNAPGSYLLACSLNSMGAIAFEQKDWKKALTCLEEAHEIAIADGAAGMMGVTKMSLAMLLSEMGERSDRPRELLRDARRIFEEKEEPLRVAQVHLLLFRVALRDGDVNQAVEDARAYLCVNHDAGLMDSRALSIAQANLEEEWRTAGYSETLCSLLP